MGINLINGSFTRKEALELISQLIQTKIDFHESKISTALDEEDVKRREIRIKDLQNELKMIRQELSKADDRINLTCEIKLD